MKKIYVIISLLFIMAPFMAQSQATDLIISEYGEGSVANSKYIELYNGTGAAVNLANYRIYMAANGAAFPGAAANLSGTLANGATYVIGNNATDVPGANTYLNGPTAFNGDDAIAIAKNIASVWTIIDVIGNGGTDPGSSWTVAGNTTATVDKRLTRKPEICSPNANWASSAGTTAANSEWIVGSAYTTGAAVAGHTQTCTVPATASDILFTEVNADDDQFEFMTLATVNLSNYKLTDAGICSNNLFRLQEADYSFPAGLTVPQGTFVRVMWGTGTDETNASDGVISLYAGIGGGINASGEQVIAYTGTKNGAANCGGSGTNTYLGGITWGTAAGWVAATDDATSKAPNTETDFAFTATDNVARLRTVYSIAGAKAAIIAATATGVRNMANWEAGNATITLKNILFNQSNYSSGVVTTSAVGLTSATINAGALTFAGITSSTRYMIVVHAGAAPGTPSDRTTCYTGIGNNYSTAPNVIASVSGQTTADFCGTPLTGNGKVVYFDYTLPANLVVSGLAPGTQYYIAVYACNGNGYTADFGTTPAAVNFTTATGSITLTTASRGPYCNASDNTVAALSFSTNGTVTAPFVQLSNATGSFATGTTNLASTVSGSGPYTVTAIIPAGQAAGNSYRLRIISTDGVPIVSADNGSNIIINNNTVPAVIAGGAAAVCVSAATPAFTNAVAGGVWSIVNGTGTATVTAGGVVTGTSAGDVTVHYTITNGTCVNSATPVTLTVNALPANPSGSITISANPSCGPATLSFEEGTAPLLNYWQTTAAGTSTASPASSDLVLNTTGTRYVRTLNTITGCWSASSISSGLITISNLVNISAHPSSQTVISPATATFSITATNGSGYQWQWYNGTTWVNLTNAAPYSGVTTSTLTVAPTNVSYDDYEFRCVVTAGSPCTSVTSNAAILSVLPGPCGSETFANIPASASSYALRSWTGDFGGTWTATEARTDQTITGPAITFRRTGVLTSPSYPGGMGSLSFSAKFPFSESNGSLEVRVNGNLVRTVLFSEMNGSTPVNFTVNNINVTGNVILTMTSVYTSGTNNRFTIDNISWTCYNQCTPTATITNFTPSTGPVNTLVTITGSGFTGVTDAMFGAVSGTNFTVVNDNTITVKVPAGAPASDKITLVKSPCNAVSANPFVLLSQSGTCGVSGSGTVTDLFISEVYDAETGSLSYVEVFNGTAFPVTLTGVYEIRITTGTSTNNDYALTGTIPSGGVRVMLIGSGSATCSGITANDSYPSGSGFNGNDRVYLLKNGTAIDYIPNPNYLSGEAPGFSQSRTATTIHARPSMTFFSDDWTVSTTENCNNLSVAPYTLTGTTVTINPQPVDVDCNQTISFTVNASTTGTGTLSYVWRYNVPGTNTWDLVSALPGVTVTGSGTNTITITGSTAELANYQFYVDASFGSPGCTASSNAAQYKYDSRIVYRTKQSGNWSDRNTWEMSNDMTTWVNACTYPVSVNSNEILVQNTHNVVQDIDADVTVDKITINPGGTLSTNPSAAITVLNGATGADLIVNGTYIDNNNSANTISFATNATWTLGASGTIIKTNTSGAAGYRDNYEGGIATIPATANWIYRHTNSMPSSIGFASATATSPMYYPNLTLENTVAANTFSSGFNVTTPSLSTFTMLGSVNPITVKGNFDVGGAGPGFINFLNINSISPVFVAGNTIIRTGSTLRNNGDATNNGSGFDLKGDLTVDGTLINNGGAANTGLLRFSGILPQTISGTGTMDLENVDINNTAAGIVHVNRNFSIPGVLSFGSALAKLHLNTGIITIKSSATRTAQVGSIPPGTLITYGTSGGFEIERYLPALKGWRFISTPVSALTSPTITEAWREGGSTASTGYGTQITGPEGAANGFDAVTPGYSMKWYDAATGNYTMVTNTSGTLANDAGYMLFVRGDRSIGVAGTTGETNLRIKGQIRTGDQSFSVNANSFQSIGNPYASSISMPSFQAAHPALGSNHVVWDPSLNGEYSVGGYQVISSLTLPPYQASVAGTALYGLGEQHPSIQSGQAFFVFNSTGSVLNGTITEDMKETGSDIVSREDTPEDRQFLFTKLYTNTGTVADGNFVAFDDELSNDLDRDDAPKFINSGENFGMSRFGKKFSVEARNRVQANDTIHYHMSNLKEQQYKITISPEKLAATGMEGWFIDRFLNTQTPVSLASSTDITITITSNAASKAANRFFLVFKPLAGPLPVTFVSVAAQRQADRSIAIKWKVANEINIDHYEVERSANVTQFTGILSNDAQGITEYSKNDLSPLAADNFYRIKAVDIDGLLTYSNIVKVSAFPSAAAISIYPNPVVNGQLGIQFTGQDKGSYAIQLINAKGQLMYRGTVNVSSDHFNETIRLERNFASGTYQLSLQAPDGRTIIKQVLIR